jgi:hypothetical protein
MFILSFARFPALYLSSFIITSFGLALSANAKNKDKFTTGLNVWFSISLVIFLVFFAFEYNNIINKGFSTSANFFNVTTCIIAFINYVLIFTLFTKSKYYLNNPEPIPGTTSTITNSTGIPKTTKTDAYMKYPSSVNFALIAIIGVFFTSYILSLLLEILAR